MDCSHLDPDARPHADLPCRTGCCDPILLAGLACGPVFPTMMAVVLLGVQPDTMGRAVGFFFFFASVYAEVSEKIVNKKPLGSITSNARLFHSVS